MAIFTYLINGGLYKQATAPVIAFFMASADDHASGIESIASPAGWTTHKYSIAGAAFTETPNHPTEISDGWYKITLDVNYETKDPGDLLLKFEASGCDQTIVRLQIVTFTIPGDAMTLSPGAVTAAVIATGAIDADAIASNAITDAKINTGAITTAKFAVGAITSAVLANGCIYDGCIGDDAISDGTIKTGAFTARAFAAGAIHSTSIASDAINAAAIKTDAVTKIQSGLATSTALTTVDGKLPATLVDGRMDASIGAMAANTLTSTAIADDAIASAKIATGALTADAFAASSIHATALATGAIHSTAIAAAAINNMAFDEDAITSTVIADEALTTAKFALGAIDATIAPNLDAPISGVNTDIAALNNISTSDVSTTLTNQGLTTTRAAYLDLVNTNLNATVGSRAVAGDAMTLSATGQTNVQSALTTQGLTATRAAYLDLVNTNLDTTVGSRAAPADILSDVIPFSGAAINTNLNATVGSRAIPGDAMNVVAGGIVTGSFTPGAITVAVAPALDAAISTRATQAQVLDDTDCIDTAVSLRQALRIILAVLAGETSIDDGPPVIVRFRDTADSKDRVTATMVGSTRTAVTLNKT